MKTFGAPFTFMTPRWPRTEPHPALFIDRDDTLIPDVPYLNDPANVELLPGTAEGLRLFREAGYRLIVISNQSGIGRGSITPEQLMAVQARLAALLAAEGIVLDAVYCCPHSPQTDCSCRKPAPGMLLQAMKDFATLPSSSLMVGDREGDVLAGIAAGLKSLQYLRFPESLICAKAHGWIRRLPEAFALAGSKSEN